MVDWEKHKALLEEAKRLNAVGQLTSSIFNDIMLAAINEANSGRAIEAFIKYAPPEWLTQNVQLPRE